MRFWFVYLWIGIGLYVWLSPDRSPAPSGKPYQANPPSSLDSRSARPVAPSRPAYTRPRTTPNGQPWPSVAGYVKGYKKLHVNGLSTVTVDNTGNDSDVFVKLVSLDGAEAYPVRVFFVPARSQFRLNSIRPGNYDIRYRDLGSGGLSRSEPFMLEQRETYDGVQYSNITMTLYKVSRGNMQTYALSEAEF